ncbi:MAG: transposase [Saprospiraceae bacterium]
MQLHTKDVSNKSKALVDNIVKKMGGLSKPRKKFIISILILYLSMRGRYNFKGMERYGQRCEKSCRLHFEKDFDFLKFNALVHKHHLSKNCIVVFDPSYLPKSGKHTPHKGIFYSGCLGKATGGLEIGSLGIVDLDHQTAFNLETIQTPNPKVLKSEGKSLIDHYAALIIDRKEAIQGISNYLAVDGYFAKTSFVDQIKKATDLDLICKLRQDANLKYLYHGSKSKTPGRPKKYDGKVNTNKIDKRRFKQIHKNEDVILFQATVWSVGLKRKVNVVYANFLDNGKPTKRYALFFSTDLELDGILIYKFYKARFQIEFLFRDAKQYTGLTHCQARSESKLYFHFNMSLTAVGVAKVAHHLNNEKEKKSFSMADIKTSYFNELMLNLFLFNFQINPELIKNKQVINRLLDFGKIAA